MLPMTFGIIAMAGTSARVIHQTGRYKMFPVIGTSLIVLGGLYLSTLQADSPLWRLFLGAGVFGLGLGGVMQPNMLAVQNAVDPRDMGTASASVMFFRQIGGSLGTAVFLSILFGTVASDIGNEYADAATTEQFQEVLADPAVTSDPNNATVLALLTAGSIEGAEDSGVSLDDTSFIKTTNAVLAAPFEEGFAVAITRVLFISSLIALGGLLFALFIPHVPLQEKSGMETMRDDDSDEGAAVTPAEA